MEIELKSEAVKVVTCSECDYAGPDVLMDIAPGGDLKLQSATGTETQTR